MDGNADQEDAHAETTTDWRRMLRTANRDHGVSGLDALEESKGVNQRIVENLNFVCKSKVENGGGGSGRPAVGAVATR